MTGAVEPGHHALPALLNYLFLLAMLFVIAGILSAALVVQYGLGELPCPLCLLQRTALFGVAAGIVLTFRHGFSGRDTGLSLIFAILLLVVAERQTLLDIYPRPGHAYVGSAILGLHMPVWSILIALALLVAYALRLIVLGGDEALRSVPVERFPTVARVAGLLGLYVLVLCLVNFASVVVQCGLGQCHTSGYALLE